MIHGAVEKQSPHTLFYLSGSKKTTHLLSPSLLSPSLLLSSPEYFMAHSIGGLTMNTNKSPTTRQFYLLHHPAGFSQKTNNIPLMTTKYSRTVFVLMMATDQQHCRVLIRVLRVRAGLRTNGKTGNGKNVSTNSLYNSLPLIFPFPPVG